MRWLFLLLLLVPFASAHTLVTFEFTIHSDDTVVMESMKVQEGKLINEEGDYKLLALDSDSNILYESTFYVSFEAITDAFPGEEEIGNVALTQVTVLLSVPYDEEVTEIQIIRNDRKIFSQEISFCNNDGVCTPPENSLMCSDCASGSQDGLCDGIFDNVCDPDCKLQGREYADTDCTCGDGECNHKEDFYTCQEDCGSGPNFFKTIAYTAIGVVLLVVILVVMLMVYIRRRESGIRD